MIGKLETDAAAMMAGLHAACFERGWTAQAFVDLIDKSGAVAYGAAHGFICLQPHAAQWEILTLAVAPQAQRQGLGRALVDKGFELAAPAPLWLEVAADNQPALALYRACGFVETGQRKAYYIRAGQNRVDALLMTGRGEQG